MTSSVTEKPQPTQEPAPGEPQSVRDAWDEILRRQGEMK